MPEGEQSEGELFSPGFGNRKPKGKDGLKSNLRETMIYFKQQYDALLKKEKVSTEEWLDMYSAYKSFEAAQQELLKNSKGLNRGFNRAKKAVFSALDKAWATFELCHNDVRREDNARYRESAKNNSSIDIPPVALRELQSSKKTMTAALKQCEDYLDGDKKLEAKKDLKIAMINFQKAYKELLNDMNVENLATVFEAKRKLNNEQERLLHVSKKGSNKAKKGLSSDFQEAWKTLGEVSDKVISAIDCQLKEPGSIKVALTEDDKKVIQASREGMEMVFGKFDDYLKEVSIDPTQSSSNPRPR